MVTCPRCASRLIADPRSDETFCLQCGWYYVTPLEQAQAQAVLIVDAGRKAQANRGPSHNKVKMG